MNPQLFINRVINEVYAFSPYDNNFKRLAPMNYNRSYHGCCSHAGGVFVCGGKEGLPSTCGEKLNTEENKWKFVARMNVERTFLKVVSC